MSTGNAAVLDQRYALEDVLGRGGMADVYRATDLLLRRAVAVKVLRENAEDGSDRARFHDEARTLASLSHPNLTTLLDAGISGDHPYLVMELVEGRTLAECCAGSPLDPARVAHIGTQLADVLAYAHDRGVVHRDVKPANVLLTDTDRAVLTDFGIARLLSATSHHTRTGTTIGSPAYLAPEQVRSEPVTAASDIYSLGLVLLEALTGRRAYAGPPTEAALARLSTPPAIPDDLAQPWADLVRSMTELDPSVRPSAEDVAAVLRHHAAGTGEQEPERTQVLTSPVDGPVLPPPKPLDAHPPVGDTVVLRDTAPRAESARRWAAGLAARARGMGKRWRAGAAPPRADRRSQRMMRLALISALVAATVVLLVIAAFSPDHPASRRTPDVPPNVPTNLQDPLKDLHTAIDGDAR